MLGVKNPAMRKQKRNDDVLKKKKEKEKNIKVTYISSPMKVETSASNFRALVQELTGQDSNVAEKFLESADYDENDENDAAVAAAANGDGQRRKGGDQHGDEGYVPQNGGSWLDLLSEDCGGFQYSRFWLEPFNQHHLKFDLVQI